ncbi:MAG: YbhB/YbcL family Raf kinase inhibitor-like protein [Candidatus Aquicultor sp.]
MNRTSGMLSVVILILCSVIFTGCSGKTETTGVTATSESTTPSTTAGAISTTAESTMKLASTSLQNGGTIPVKYANTSVPGGQNISIPLEWNDAPAGTKSFAISIIDTSANNWVHWMVINIPATTTSLPEGASGKKMPVGSKELTNTFGAPGYGGAQPPPGSGPHNYVIIVYALDTGSVSMLEQPTADEFEQALDEKALAKTSLTATFSRQ